MLFLIAGSRSIVPPALMPITALTLVPITAAASVFAILDVSFATFAVATLSVTRGAGGIRGSRSGAV